jgi:hypothetical protein
MRKAQMLWLIVCLLFATSVSMARDLKPGMAGEDVKKWQMFLKTRNFDLPADGQYGPVTKRATIIFQKKWNLYPDGWVGKQTLRKARELGFGSSGGSGASTYSKATLSSKVVARKIYSYLMENLHDPSSLQLINGSDLVKTSNRDVPYLIRFKFRSKNGFGAYVVGNKFFFLDKDGDVVAVRDVDK